MTCASGFCITGKRILAPELLVSGRFRPAVSCTSHTRNVSGSTNCSQLVSSRGPGPVSRKQVSGFGVLWYLVLFRICQACLWQGNPWGLPDILGKNVVEVSGWSRGVVCVPQAPFLFEIPSLLS